MVPKLSHVQQQSPHNTIDTDKKGTKACAQSMAPLGADKHMDHLPPRNATGLTQVMAKSSGYMPAVWWA